VKRGRSGFFREELPAFDSRALAIARAPTEIPAIFLPGSFTSFIFPGVYLYTIWGRAVLFLKFKILNLK
jgi:hypothetical protein